MEYQLGPEGHTTVLILDLRDRMARIETKLDGHQEAHTVIDRRLDAIEEQVGDIASRTSSNSAEVAASKARYATLVAVGSGVVSTLGLFGDHIWKALTGH